MLLVLQMEEAAKLTSDIIFTKSDKTGGETRTQSSTSFLFFIFFLNQETLTFTLYTA